MENFDVVIVGAGIVGASLALSLAQQTDLRIALLECNTLKSDVDVTRYSPRVSAITASSARFLQALAVWEDIANTRMSPYVKMQVWDAQGTGQLNFTAASSPTKQLGWIVEDKIILNSLLQRLQQTTVAVSFPIDLLAMTKVKDGYELETSKGLMKTNLLIGADGANSWVRKQAGIHSVEKDYTQTAIVTHVTHEVSHDMCAYQRFLSTGPLAFLPLATANASSIVWSTQPAHAKALLAMTAEEFNHALATAFENKLGKITSCDTLLSFPLRMRHVQQYVQSHFALIGDAAHTIHPLAGQGVNLGLADVNKLSQVIVSAIAKQKDFASHAVLRPYERTRKAENAEMLLFVDLIQQVFSSSNEKVIYLRNKLFNFVDASAFLKTFFIKQANGYVN